MCTGSGCLGLSVAHNTNVNVTLVDISKKALKVAKHNNKYNNDLRAKEEKVAINPNFVLSNLFSNVNCKYDIIVCNPPYFCNSLVSPDAKRTMARHTSELEFKDLLSSVKRLISSNGLFLLFCLMMLERVLLN
jgi:tRNA1(Val) A37 N6-methylase TrmN6